MLTVRAGLSDSAKARKGHERHATQSIKKDKTELDLNTGKKAKEKLEPGSHDPGGRWRPAGVSKSWSVFSHTELKKTYSRVKGRGVGKLAVWEKCSAGVGKAEMGKSQRVKIGAVLCKFC